MFAVKNRRAMTESWAPPSESEPEWLEPDPSWMSETRNEASRPLAAPLILGAAGIVLLAGAYYLGPDLVRYLKLRRM